MDTVKVGSFLKELRKEKGLTREQLCIIVSTFTGILVRKEKKEEK